MNPKLRKLFDIAAIIAVAFLPLFALWTEYETPVSPVPGTVDFETKLLFADGLPAVLGILWLSWKHASARPGTYPFLDKCVRTGRDRFMSVLVILLIFFVLFDIVHHIRR